MLESKSSVKPITIRPDASLQEAADLMRKQHIGDLFVTRGENDYPVGILTDRDLAVRAIADQKSKDLKVSDVMSASVVCAKTTDDAFTVVQLMRQNGVTRLPVVDQDEKIVGVMTARKLITMFSEAIRDLTRIGEKQKAREAEIHH